jgi:type VI secretion system secreted protein VgrG
MTTTRLLVADTDAALDVRSVLLREALGEPTDATIEAFAPEPVRAKDVLGKACVLVLTGARGGERVVHGIVTRFGAIATAQAAPGRRYELRVRSAVHRLSLRRSTRVFQHATTPDIVSTVLESAGIPAHWIERSLARSYAEREYVVQYQEDDLSFLRRLCEDEGFWFRFEPRDGFDALVFEDTSAAAPRAFAAPLVIVDGAGLTPDADAAWDVRGRRARRTGKVTLRDHDFARPDLSLLANAEAGADSETVLERYVAPGRFRSPGEGAERARILLESLRADAVEIRFRTTATAIAPGHLFDLAPSDDHRAAVRTSGTWFAVEVLRRFRADAPVDELEVVAIPASSAYRLPGVTAKPRIAGVHTAIVTGPAGQEIHTDAAGRVTVRFPWDRSGPDDDRSSLPVRVLQPNMPGSMLIPRVGWEVAVAFEDGDPDRPFVIGRVYNAKQPPPFSLPANKTVTALATASSPGGGGKNSVHFDDAAGRQHMAWAAAFGKATVVGNNMVTQTIGNEIYTVGGLQSVTVGANDKVSIGEAFVTGTGTQMGVVGGAQAQKVLGEMGVETGGETVLIGAALLEDVGDPVTGVVNLGKAGLLHAVGELGKLGKVFSAAAGIVDSAYQGYQAEHGSGWGAVRGAAKGTVDLVAGLFPGGDAIVAAADGSGHAPWLPPEELAKQGEQAEGGGAAGPSAAASGSSGPAPGHRVEAVDGAMTQLIGGPHAIMSPGPVKWTALGQSTTLIGGSHNIQAAKVETRTAGASSDQAASILIDAATIAKEVDSSLSRTIGGSLTVGAGGDYRVRAGEFKLSVSGALSIDGGIVVFKCGGSTVSASSGGVLLKSSSITINGEVVQSGKASTK